MVAKDYKPLSNWQNYWEFLGTSPLLFNGIYLSCQPDCDTPICNEYWSYYDYNNKPNMTQLLRCLCQAELDIESVLGTSLLQKKYCDTLEIDRNYLTFRKPGINIESMIFKTNTRHVIEFGQETETEFINDVVFTYSDVDIDNFKELASIEFIYTENTELCQYKYYLSDSDFEVKPFKVRVLDSVTRLAEALFYSWDLVEIKNYITHSWKPQKAVDGCDITNFIESINIRYVEISKCKPHGYVRFADHICNGKCDIKDIPFCVIPMDLCSGTFQIRLGSLDTNGCFIAGTCPQLCDCPINIVIFYNAGLCEQCNSTCHDGFCQCKKYEHMIFVLAATCLSDYAKCCQCLVPNINKYQQNTNLIVKSEGVTWNYSQSQKDNPFNSMVGGIETWTSVQRMFDDTRLCLSNID